MITNMTREELEAALYIAMENRRILAEAVLEDRRMMMDDDVSGDDWMAHRRNMYELAEGMVK